MAKPGAPPPPTPEELFADCHALRADPAATREAYDALAKKTRAAKASWTKAGDQARRQQLADLQNYITRFKPVEASRLLTRESLDREVASPRAALKTRSGGELHGAVRAEVAPSSTRSTLHATISGSPAALAKAKNFDVRRATPKFILESPLMFGIVARCP